MFLLASQHLPYLSCFSTHSPHRPNTDKTAPIQKRASRKTVRKRRKYFASILHKNMYRTENVNVLNRNRLTKRELAARMASCADFSVLKFIPTTDVLLENIVSACKSHWARGDNLSNGARTR